MRNRPLEDEETQIKTSQKTDSASSESVTKEAVLNAPKEEPTIKLVSEAKSAQFPVHLSDSVPSKEEEQTRDLQPDNRHSLDHTVNELFQKTFEQNQHESKHKVDGGSAAGKSFFSRLELLIARLIKVSAICTAALLVGIIALLLSMLFFHRQIVDLADAELKKYPYFDIQLKKIVDPLLDGSQSERLKYVELLKKTAIAISECQSRLSGRVANFYRRDFETGALILEPVPPGTATDSLRAVIEEIQKNDGSNPIPALLYFTIGDAKIRQGMHDFQVEDALQRSADSAAKLLNPNNCLVAAANRRLAEYYIQTKSYNPISANEHASIALRIDSLGTGEYSGPALEDKRLLTMIAVFQGDSNLADQRWKEFLKTASEVRGANSLDNADAKLAHAMYLLESKRMNLAVQEAAAALSILRTNDHKPTRIEQINDGVYQLRHLDPRPASASFDKVNDDLTKFIKALSAQTIDASSRKSVLMMEDQYIAWSNLPLKKNALRPNIFNVLCDYADWHRGMRDYARADFIYKSALLYGKKLHMQDGLTRVQSFFRPKSDGLDDYVYCMAKTAHNCFLQGNTSEGLRIFQNCLTLIDPYNAWKGNLTGSDQIVAELTAAIKEIPATEMTSELKQAKQDLDSKSTILRSRYLYSKEPHRNDSTVLLAEQAELNGDLQLAEKYYREALVADERSSRSLGTLGAFLDKQGRFEEAARLYSEGEKKVRGNRPGDANVAVINQAKLKRILDSLPDKSLLNNLNLEWYKNVSAVFSGPRTHKELGEAYFILDLRPFVKDCRRPSDGSMLEPGVVYSTSSARADFAQLTKEQLVLVKKFDWYANCYLKDDVVRDSLPDRPVSGLAPHVNSMDSVENPNCVRDLLPERLLIIPSADVRLLEKMLGRKLQSSQNAP